MHTSIVVVILLSAIAICHAGYETKVFFGDDTCTRADQQVSYFWV